MASFIPREVFPILDSLPRSYFLGHHRAGLNKMKTMLTHIDLVIECRDYRVPFTSRNILFEENLAGRERLIVYTKKDLGCEKKHGESNTVQREKMIRTLQHPTPVLFSAHHEKSSARRILGFAQEHAAAKQTLTGSKMMVVGMPNVGKSSLLNALRNVGINKKKVARTGAQPGITRKLSTEVKIINGKEKDGDVYLVDTPGVFIPYVQDYEAMLKLALCGCVKDDIIDPALLADYLLYRMNMIDPLVYAGYSAPTNDIVELLDAVAYKTGRFLAGGQPNERAAALWIIQRWRSGKLGRFGLDEVSTGKMDVPVHAATSKVISLNQARLGYKKARRSHQTSNK